MLAVVLLQVEPHRIVDERAVLGPPRLRHGAEHEIFERLLSERREAGIDASGVGVEEGALPGRGVCDDLLGEPAEAVHARAAVHAHSGGTEEFRQFARGAAPLEIHLEKPLLSVEKAERPHDVGAHYAGDGRHAERVARNIHRRAESGQLHPAIELRQARAQLKIKPDACRHGEEQKHADGAREEPETFGGGRLHTEKARRICATIAAGGCAMSTASASRGDCSAASCEASISGPMK